MNAFLNTRSSHKVTSSWYVRESTVKPFKDSFMRLTSCFAISLDNEESSLSSARSFSKAMLKVSKIELKSLCLEDPSHHRMMDSGTLRRTPPVSFRPYNSQNLPCLTLNFSPRRSEASTSKLTHTVSIRYFVKNQNVTYTFNLRPFPLVRRASITPRIQEPVWVHS